MPEGKWFLKIGSCGFKTFFWVIIIIIRRFSQLETVVIIIIMTLFRPAFCSYVTRSNNNTAGAISRPCTILKFLPWFDRFEQPFLQREVARKFVCLLEHDLVKFCFLFTFIRSLEYTWSVCYTVNYYLVWKQPVFTVYILACNVISFSVLLCLCLRVISLVISPCFQQEVITTNVCPRWGAQVGWRFLLCLDLLIIKNAPLPSVKSDFTFFIFKILHDKSLLGKCEKYFIVTHSHSKS